jgi:hypothetical protein
MFNLFRRKSTQSPQVDSQQVQAQVSAADAQLWSQGRMPEDAAAGGAQNQATSEYIAEAETPSEAVWEREQALYRSKNEPEQPG